MSSIPCSTCPHRVGPAAGECFCAHQSAYQPSPDPQISRYYKSLTARDGGRYIGRLIERPEWCPLLITT